MDMSGTALTTDAIAWTDASGHDGERRLWRAVLGALLSDSLGVEHVDLRIPKYDRPQAAADAREWLLSPSLVDVCDLADMDPHLVADVMLPKVRAAAPVIVPPRRKRGPQPGFKKLRSEAQGGR